MVARQMGLNRIGREHQAVGLTAYYSGLKPLNESNPIEINVNITAALNTDGDAPVSKAKNQRQKIITTMRL